jgi:hypothetical protein
VSCGKGWSAAPLGIFDGALTHGLSLHLGLQGHLADDAPAVALLGS